MGVKFIVTFFCISIILGLTLSIYVRFYRENISTKDMAYGIKKFIMYQIMAPLFSFPKIVTNNKKIFADFLIKEILGVNDENKKNKMIEVLVNEWDYRLTFIIWKAYLIGINNNYDTFTNQNIEFIKRDIRCSKKQYEVSRKTASRKTTSRKTASRKTTSRKTTSRKTTLRKQIILLETNKSKSLLQDKLIAAIFLV